MRLYFAGIKSAQYILGKVPRIDVLVSYLEKWVPPPELVGRRFLDSGAYSAWNSGREIILRDYIDYCHIVGEWDIIAGLDVIGDWKQSKQNYLDMRSDGLDILPTFHIGEPWEYYEWLLIEWDYVALGGMVPYLAPQMAIHKPALIRFLIKAHLLAQEADVKLHGFGCTTWKLVKMFQWHSVWLISAQRFARPISSNITQGYSLRNYHEASKFGRTLGLSYTAKELKPDLTTDQNTEERYGPLVHLNMMAYLNALDILNKQRANNGHSDDN